MSFQTRCAAAAVLVALVLACVTGLCCKSDEKPLNESGPAKAVGNKGTAPTAAPVMKGDPNAVPASGMKSEAERLVPK